MATATKVATAAKKKAAPTQQIKYEIRHYAELSVDSIVPNPHNPRPAFHTQDNDPKLIELGNAIKQQGQHHPGVVYEQVGHHSLPDKPGHYVLLQGERRWRGCKLTGVESYRAFVVKTPTSEAEEWDWLGIEEMFKQEWQPFFLLRYAHELAQKHGVQVTHPEMAAKTGIAPKDLRMAQAIFSLEPAIQGLCAEYEQLMYEQLVSGQRRQRARLTGSGVRTQEFPVQKAALVWEVFEALRTNVPLMVKEYTDLELQHLIAMRATASGTTVKDLQSLIGAIKQGGKNPPPGLLTQLADMLRNPSRTIKDITRATGTTEIAKMAKFMQSSERIRKEIAFLIRHIEQCGSDADTLGALAHEALRLSRDAIDLERAFEGRRRQVSV